jgi:RNA polymerase sigma-70 factor (ECF subfamily)
VDPAATGALDPVGETIPARFADTAQLTGPPRQRVPGPNGERRAVTPTVAPDPRPAPAEPAAPEDSGPWVLVRAAQAGDMNAFSELFDRYSTTTSSTATSCSG